jgi:hypothetical protein
MTDLSNNTPIIFNILPISRCPLLFFSESIPKYPEVTGTPKQAFLFVGDFTNVVVKLIQTKTISSLGTVTPGSTTLQYLVNPQIHYDLTGTPTTIIDNASNKRGEFFLLRSTSNLSVFFPYIAAKNDFNSLLLHGDDIPQFTEPLVATLIPNFIAIYHGQKFPMEISLTQS